MVGWHHPLHAHEFEQALGDGKGQGDGEGQGRLACCSPRGRKESETTEQLDNNNKYRSDSVHFSAGFPGGSAVMNLPAKQEMQKTLVQSPGLEDLLEEEMGTNSSILA